ncbi:MAG: 50S ribosomal protein L13 [Parcubacteria group bacterium CG_4_9_14_0_2_um_filter_41_8]|nr:MAG: 50S ribosomal protein L13 [Parcubacteria group bacterium CG1_02_41_12]PIP67177.1 MAG: 50S ribosomal protein L13 [Parcubacteria group bacterium CG22_combo_CG10-13_8_21_14_all_41_9]PIQ78958.1 MAG: 50S ribosomal protein L13 [Parcubacteria group bacterium CG11_big_fil_rev_8_21_14_0_20_41_14]PIR57386.1 MAG: 50S ribosomal protein L13 [Parcubacteria group bacterium CG10_big_fil_rev_8_21_14_0_10_41_35]PJC40850.1 MAG: 50S ribosomal protein L13 [Parcubacteria group bacterium CG_4_9_14_0_2_um_filt
MDRKTHKLDAANISLGRLATKAAFLLMGKHKPSYVPYKDDGDFVIIENFEKIKFTGNKMDQKMYYRPTTRPGKLKSETLGSLFERRPKEVLRKAVLGMLPKNKLRAKMIKRLEVK